MVLLLSAAGLVILALVRKQTGTDGFLVGLGLAVLPVPLLLAAVRWMDRVEPKPWRTLVFAFAWGACAATLVALLANSFATQWLSSALDDSSSTDPATWSATVVAPVVEESAKGAAVLWLFLLRRREFNGVLDGIVTAAVTAVGFAFTENILYLGTAYVSDQAYGYSGFHSTTAATFFVRGVMSPFAHPLFTAMTGIGFGMAAARPPGRRARRYLLPLAALLLAMGLHGAWNGGASLGGLSFLAVYGLGMVPAFGLLIWLAVWSRNRELRTVGRVLTSYQAAGWLTPPEPAALSSLRARGIATDVARRVHGAAAARTVAEYISGATSLALLRHRTGRSAVVGDFAVRERELLDYLWRRRLIGQPALAHAALALPRWLSPAHPWPTAASWPASWHAAAPPLGAAALSPGYPVQAAAPPGHPFQPSAPWYPAAPPPWPPAAGGPYPPSRPPG